MAAPPTTRETNERAAQAAPTTWSFAIERDDEVGARLDVVIGRSAKLRGFDLSRARIARLIAAGHVDISSAHGEQTSARKPSYRIRPREQVTVTVPAPTPLHDMTPAAMPLCVLFEDEHLLVINKPPHLPVHPGAGAARVTLVHALLARDSHFSGIGGVLRPGIVHRLDADTTGVMVVAKSDMAHRHLAAQFAARTVKKLYLALCQGPLPRRAATEGLIDTPFGRHPTARQKMTGLLARAPRRARTRYRVLATEQDRLLVQLRLLTGRTHQARVHLAELGTPVLGDAVYASARSLQHARRLGVSHHALHAHCLSFVHPATEREMRFEAPILWSFAHLLPLARDRRVCNSAPRVHL